METVDLPRKRIRSSARRIIRLLIEVWLWLMSWAPTHAMRVFGLRIAGAKIGRNVAIGRGARALYPWRLSIGANTIIGLRVCLDARGGLTIGSSCNIADDIAVWTAEHDIQSPEFAMTEAPTIIGDRVWICYRSILLPGVNVGEGSVVASGSVVTKGVPPFSVVGGVPAKVIGKRNEHLTYQLGRSAV
jgi:putative colanic acid biosynthesis acetyltransferase WcaF